MSLEIDLKRIAIHEISKTPKEKDAKAFFTETLIEVNDKSRRLIQKLNNSYSNNSIFYAVFSDEPEKDFPTRFLDYLKVGESSFLIFTKKTIATLRDQINQVFFAKGGYFIFAEYIVSTSHYLSVYLVRDTDGVLFNRGGNSFELNEIKYLNTEKLAMGCRISINKYQKKEGKYISLIKNKSQEELSNYFSEWIAIMQPDSSADYTHALYEVINNIQLPINPETGQPLDLNDFRKKVVDHVRSNHNIVNLRTMGLMFYNNENAFTNYIDINNIQLDTEFKADGRVLKKFYNVEINTDNIRLRFVRGDFNDKIRFSEDNKNLVIIESEKFAERLRKEIKEWE